MAAVSLTKRLAVYERDGYRCRGCGFETTRERVLELLEAARRNCGRFPIAELLTIDHVVPRCRGGSNAESNLQTLCFPCNNLKGSRLPDGVSARSVRAERKKARMLDERDRRGRLVLRGKEHSGFATVGDRVQHLPGCCPVVGCVGHCPVPTLGFLISAAERR